jgi:glycosyltransferase involved in cell wall biosynthesis
MKSAGRDVVLLSTADWDNPSWTNKQHMATLFARRGYRVLYVDSLGLRRPTLKIRDLRRMLGRLLKSLPWPCQVYPNIWRVSPLLAPFHSQMIVRAINRFLLLWLLRWYMFLLGMRRPLVWLYDPLTADLGAELAGLGLAYHCVDDLAAVPGINGQAVRQAENRLAELADICFVTSPLLRESRQKTFKRVFYEPNVCDYDFFATARLGLAEPEDIKAIPHPRLIFVGALSGYKLDFKLIEALAGRRPEIHWLFIGEQGLNSPWDGRPPLQPNIHILGHRHHGRLPYYLAHAEAAVLPELRNDYTAAMFPMKFFEYLAAGLPVVGIRLPALAEFEDLYFPADTPEEFEAQISRVLAGERRDAGAILAACLHNSWEARFVRMERAWEDLL